MSVEMVRFSLGLTHANVVVYSLDLSRQEACDLLVDTGSTLSWVPEGLAHRLGIRPTEIRKFRTVDGRVLERPVGEAMIECEGVRGATRIVFARPEDGALLGLHALEGLGLEVNPTTRTLRKTDAYLALVTA